MGFIGNFAIKMSGALVINTLRDIQESSILSKEGLAITRSCHAYNVITSSPSSIPCKNALEKLFDTIFTQRLYVGASVAGALVETMCDAKYPTDIQEGDSAEVIKGKLRVSNVKLLAGCAASGVCAMVLGGSFVEASVVYASYKGVNMVFQGIAKLLHRS